jgi:hypothetical protein
MEVQVPVDLLERILRLAGSGMILVGGQALAFWAAYYHTSAMRSTRHRWNISSRS